MQRIGHWELQKVRDRNFFGIRGNIVHDGCHLSQQCAGLEASLTIKVISPLCAEILSQIQGVPTLLLAPYWKK